MKSALVRLSIAIAAIIAVGAGVLAAGQASTSMHALQIPTVVAGKPVASTEPRPSSLTSQPSADGTPASRTSATTQAGHASSTASPPRVRTADSNSDGDSAQTETKRQIVTPTVRNDGDGDTDETHAKKSESDAGDSSPQSVSSSKAQSSAHSAKGRITQSRTVRYRRTSIGRRARHSAHKSSSSGRH